MGCLRDRVVVSVVAGVGGSIITAITASAGLCACSRVDDPGRGCQRSLSSRGYRRRCRFLLLAALTILAQIRVAQDGGHGGPRFWVGGEELQDEGLGLQRHPRREVEAASAGSAHGAHKRGHAALVERDEAAQHDVQRHAVAPHVRGIQCRAGPAGRPLQHLRCGVLRRADVRRRPRRRRHVRVRGKAKVRQPHVAGHRVHKNVLGLHVPVAHACCMAVRQRPCELTSVSTGSSLRDASGGDMAVQVATADVLHYQKVLRAAAHDVLEAHTVSMVDGGQHSHLTTKLSMHGWRGQQRLV